jgi:hypothetical protein
MLIHIKSVITPVPANIYICLSLPQRIMTCKIRDKIWSRSASRNITNDLMNLNIELNRHVLCMKGNRIPWAQENTYVKEPLVELSNMWRAQLTAGINKQKWSNTKHQHNAVNAGWEGCVTRQPTLPRMVMDDDVLKICFCTTYQQFNNSEPQPFHLKSTIMSGYFLNVINIHFRQ